MPWIKTTVPSRKLVLGNGTQKRHLGTKSKTQLGSLQLLLRLDQALKQLGWGEPAWVKRPVLQTG